MQQCQHSVDYDVYLKLKTLTMLHLLCSCSSGWSHATGSDCETRRIRRVAKQVSCHKYSYITIQGYAIALQTSFLHTKNVLLLSVLQNPLVDRKPKYCFQGRKQFYRTLIPVDARCPLPPPMIMMHCRATVSLAVHVYAGWSLDER